MCRYKIYIGTCKYSLRVFPLEKEMHLKEGRNYLGSLLVLQLGSRWRELRDHICRQLLRANFTKEGLRTHCQGIQKLLRSY
jgi:hypothetical protein